MSITFKEMNPEDALTAIEGHKDILSPAAEDQDGFYSTFHCPRCRGELQKEFDSKHVFGAKNIIARALLRCPNCRYLIDPHTNIILETGDASKIPISLIPIIGTKERSV